MSLKPQSGGHSKHALAIHLVWCVKYRRSVLTHEVGDRLKVLVAEIASAQGCEIISIETSVDHVHVLLRIRPTTELSKLVQLLKGKTAYVLFREFAWIKNRLRGGHLWSPSYYACSVGGAPLETIKKYISEQRTK